MFWSTVEADKKGQTLENKVNARTFSQRAQGVAGKLCAFTWIFDQY